MPRPIKLGTLTDSGSTLTLQPSTVFIGGQQIRTTTLTTTLSGLTTGVRYYVYVVNTLTPQLVVSPNDNTAGPTGFTAWGLVGSFYAATATTVAWYVPTGNSLAATGSTTSSTHTPVGANIWHAMTGNSVTLTPGVYRLNGIVYLNSPGASASYIYCSTLFHTSNGNNTGSLAAFNGTNVYYLTAVTESFQRYANLVNTSIMPLSPVIRVINTTTIFLNVYSDQITNANARIQTVINYEKLD